MYRSTCMYVYIIYAMHLYNHYNNRLYRERRNSTASEAWGRPVASTPIAISCSHYSTQNYGPFSHSQATYMYVYALYMYMYVRVLRVLVYMYFTLYL